MDDDAITGLASGSAGIAIGAYLVAVAYNGNVKQLGSLLYHEERYIEVLIAIFSLNLLQSYAPTHKVLDALIALTFLGLLLRVADKVTIGSAFTDLASGKKSLLDTAKTILGVN